MNSGNENIDDEKKIIEKRSSFRGWKERNKGKSNPKIRIIGVVAMVVIFSTLIIYYSYLDTDINKNNTMDKNNTIIPVINTNSSNGVNNSSSKIVITPEITQAATPKITKNIIGKMGTPFVINGFEINVTKVSSSSFYTNVWITVKNIDNKEKPFTIGPSTVILDNIGFQYEKVHVIRSSEIAQTNLASKALREGSIFFETLKEGRTAKKLILDLKVEKAEILLEK
ncbi:MAG: hypothetical protein OIN86_00580 [Candidatus Methanoperedens sp.]|nr:hypothetical protein [Candidatus Methanoperedens sp.]CAG1005781.1 hypothetical protein METP1_03274 [Methanosarcinales archaeon]